MLVVSIEQAVAAPLCTLRLADAGARVIKIERREGETARNYDATVEGVSAYFVWLNRGKESVVLDLKSADDLALLHRMVARADVFVQNLAPGAADRLGLSDDELGRRHPRLISVGIVGYGQDTSAAAMRAYDMLVQAESGLCAVTGTPETPSKVGVSAADMATGMNAHAAVLEALIARERTGQGQALEISMFDGMADWMTVPLLHYEHAGLETGRYGLAHASIYPYRAYTCACGQQVVIAIQQNAEWRRFCSAVLRRPELDADDRFGSNEGRVASRDALDEVIEPVFAAMGRDEAIGRLDEGRIAWGRMMEVRDLPNHPALRRMAVTLPGGRQVSLPSPAGRTASLEERHPPAIPALGAHTADVRSEFSRGIGSA